MNKRDIYRYHIKVGHKIVHTGITDDPGRRELELQKKWRNARISVQGPAVTEETARDWENQQRELGKPTENSRRASR